MTKNRHNVAFGLAGSLAFMLCGSAAFAQTAPALDDDASVREQTSDSPEPATDATGPDDFTAMGEVIEIVDRVVPGSAQIVDSEELERFEYNDVHRVLGSVAGVYIREEDGYGLRPNIGMRGSGSERSAKIALMEDGVLIAPAPYAAPAAYYFPLITRMERVDVLKGPAAIQYGPNTVGGAVNMVSRSIPYEREATLDMAAGQNLFGKLHAGYAESHEYVAFLIEGIKLRTDGFKQLDGGGDTGFDKNDAQLKLRLSSNPERDIFHRLMIKLGYADERSNETYTGLTDADFAATPYRRYAGTQLDRMEWRHIRTQVDHVMDIDGNFELTTTVYRNMFSRAWTKLNRFNTDRALDAILANPTSGNNGVFYAVLTGQASSASDAEILMIGTNDRDYVSQGFQLSGRAERTWWRTSHQFRVGLRYHVDKVDRLHYEDGHWMMGGALVRTDDDRLITRDSHEEARALAVYVQDKVRVGDVTVTAGARTELVETDSLRRMPEDEVVEGGYLVLIPGAGAVYQVTPSLGVLAGVHKGFVPVAPGQDSSIKPEQSINYEAGVRYASELASVEAIGFFSDYSNLKETCRFSIGCGDGQIDSEFNGGEVLVYGLEFVGGADLWLGSRVRLPFRLSYTLNQSRFRTAFTSDNPQWGDIEPGDELPYLPAHQISLQAGAGGQRWDVSLAGRYTSAMRDVAGQGDTAPGQRTDAATVLDIAASYQLGRYGKLYATIDNALDQAHIVSRRPFGARPGKPRLVMLGYKNAF